MQLAEISGVHAMHDATEGGFVAALNELAEASKVGFRVDWEKIPVSKEALALQSYFKFTDEQAACLCLQQARFWRRLIPAQEKVETSCSPEWALSLFFGGIHGK